MPQPCLIVAEVAQAHEGSLGLAHSFIDAAARAGAGAIKFQTHIAAAESTLLEPWRVRFSRQDASRFDYWKRMEFTEEQWLGLRRHAAEAGLLFASSPFSVEAIELLERIGVEAWKIASGEVNNLPFLERLQASRVPVWLSTGMSALAEIDSAVQLLSEPDRALTILQCTSMYPTPPEKVGLNLLDVYRQRYGCPVGLSDHSGAIYAGLAAATLGADLLEVHLTLSREMFGPDVPVSLTPDQLRQLADGVRQIERMRAHPVDKDAVAQELSEMRRTFGKSIMARRPLAAGTVLAREHLTFKKPGTGIPSGELARVLGRRLARDLAPDVPLAEADLV